MEWYYVWWPWLTSNRVARICQHQLSFLFGISYWSSSSSSSVHISEFRHRVHIQHEKQCWISVLFSEVATCCKIFSEIDNRLGRRVPWLVARMALTYGLGAFRQWLAIGTQTMFDSFATFATSVASAVSGALNVVLFLAFGVLTLLVWLQEGQRPVCRNIAATFHWVFRFPINTRAGKNMG